MVKEKKQRDPRVTKRLEVKFSSAGLSFRGILSNISENGLFIRTNNCFTKDTPVDIELMMPDSKVSFLKGIVRWSLKTPLKTLKNGMGIELIEKDQIFTDFIKSIYKDTKEQEEGKPSQDFQIISCKKCGVKNKILKEKIYLSPKCGRCGRPLILKSR